jgi:hypothetical protein
MPLKFDLKHTANGFLTAAGTCITQATPMAGGNIIPIFFNYLSKKIHQFRAEKAQESG